MSAFKPGNRVRRCKDVYDQSKGAKTGTVAHLYSEPTKKVGSLILGPYPELYSVHFDDGTFSKAFLPHGLCHEKAKCPCTPHKSWKENKNG